MSIGTIVDMHLERKKYGSKVAHPFYIFSSGLIFWGGSTYILAYASILDYPLRGNGNGFLFTLITGAVVISIIGAWISRTPVKN